MAIDNASISTDDAGMELPALLEKMAVSEDLEEMRTRITSLMRRSRVMPHLVARTKELQLQPRYSPQQMVIVIYKRLLQNVQEHLQVDRQIAESLEVYRKASHRDLCQKITVALPREIRDIIYRHVNTATYTAVGPNRPTEHYRTAAHVGGTIAYEMAESWYRTSLFTVYENDKEAKRCSETGLLFDRDVFGMGFSPEQLVSNLRMVYSIDLAGTNELNLASRMVSRATEHANRLVKKVDLLDILPDRVHLTVVLRATNVFGPASSCKPLLASTFLSRILPILQRQQKIGKAITLRLDDLGDFEFNAEDAVLSPQIWLERIEQAKIRLRPASMIALRLGKNTDFWVGMWAKAQLRAAWSKIRGFD